LLYVNRCEIEAYCSNHNLAPVIDESNRDTTFYRNRLRHELIPLLEEYNPGIRKRLQNMAVIMNDEERLLADLVGQEWERLLMDTGPGWLTLDRAGWRSTPIGLQRRLIRQAILTLLPDLRNVGFRTTEQAREVASSADIGSTSSLPEGVSLLVDYDHLLFSMRDASTPTPNLPQLINARDVNLDVPGHLRLENGWMIQAQMLDQADSRMVLENQDPWQAFVGVEEPASIMVRGRRSGERFQPLGMSGRSAKVSRVMIDRKIPERLRAKWPIVASQKHLLWLVGHHIDERVRVDENRQKVLYLRSYREVDG
jgi:tRNA(Ile)-lysidine synthase